MYQPKCEQQDCSRSDRLRRGLCDLHYHRLRRHGSADVVKPARRGPARNPFRAVWKHVLLTDTCWLWTGPLNQQGYGRAGARLAHRAVFVRLVAPVPVGLQLDHLCRVRNCVRPDHLEPVTAAENVRRAAAARQAVAA